METSNLIALGALLVASIGLIPQFLQIANHKKSKHKGKLDNKKLNSLNREKSQNNEVNNPSETTAAEQPMPFMLRILMLVVFAVGTFLIEIIIFGIIAHYSGVSVDLNTMTLLWKIIFYSLFFIPGVFLFLAFLTFVANTTD